MSLRKHAELEFKAAGWVDDNGKFNDDMQELMCKQVIELLDLFASHGHSGSSAPYAIHMFEKLASYKSVVPLTGEDWEWSELDYDCDPKYQNKRCGNVFKDADGKAYDIDGKVFFDWLERPLEEDEEGYPGVHRFKSYFTSRDSRVYIEFPYTPTTEYVERPSHES
jgi:hypothetical protein